MADLPTGTVTFLFTDIEGSTRLWETQAEWMRHAFARQETILRQTISDHGGYAYKMIGDAFQAAFQTAAAALAAAVAAQHALIRELWGDSGPLRVRMALHTCVVEERGDDYVGPMLNRVARLLAAGYGGQILLSAATSELLHDALPAGVSLQDLGPHRLKDLQRPEHIFQVVGPDLQRDFPPLKTLERRPNNLPLQLTTFVGRKEEETAILQRLRDPKVRLLTLTGPGGIGKTRLALQVAADLIDTFGDGVYFVDLAPISDPTFVAAIIAQTLGIQEGGGRSPLDSLKATLRERQALLVLDNFEHVAPAAPMLADLLAAAPLLKALVTSRAIIGVYGEHDYHVPPLALPPMPGERGKGPQEMQDLSGIQQYAAVTLFLQQAQAVKPDYALTAGDAQAVVEICRRVDGLPLAIELAAARIRHLPPQTLLTQLGSRLKLLTGGARTLPARQQTLRNTIAWSYDLLSAKEQQLFRRLGVFAGGWTLEAAEAVCNAMSDLPVDVLDGLASLLDKSLVRQSEGLAGDARFMMLETIREYALEQMAACGELEALRRHHADYCVRRASRAGAAWSASGVVAGAPGGRA